LLGILHARCQELGVEVFAEHEVASLDEHREADAVIIADGAHSRLRDAWADRFAPNVEWGSSRFCWLGAALDLDAFTFHFRPTPRGLFQVHAYPYAPGRATWIVECAEATWQRAGLREDDEAATVAHLSALFAEELGGRELEANGSIWRRFPTVR